MAITGEEMGEKKGRLYGIGVGPGDPELITLKAVKALKEVDIVFTAASSKNSFSLAVEIAGPHIPEGISVEMLPFPMSGGDMALKMKAWQEHSERITCELDRGKRVAFLTLGDPMTYSTYGYVLQCIKEKKTEYDIITIPGITSFQAAAACVNIPLVEGEESLLLTSGAYGGNHLRYKTGIPENVVFLKAYKNVIDIEAALEERNMLSGSLAVSKCSREDEKVFLDIRELKNRKPDYWTLILAKQPKNGVCKKEIKD